MLHIIEQLLKANDIEHFQLYDNAEEFLKHLSSDIIVCAIDYYLNSGLNGLDVLKAVKKKNKSSFVIIISGVDDPKVLKQFINNGADKYVDKNGENYKRELVEYIIEGLNESKKKWGLIKYLENIKNGQ
jgi:DNA-binding NarL/FixJ family response regulator